MRRYSRELLRISIILVLIPLLAVMVSAGDVTEYPATNQFMVCDQACTPGYVPLSCTPDNDHITPDQVDSGLLLSSSGFLPELSSGTAGDDSWEQFAKDVRHTGFTTADAPDTNSLSWSADITAMGAPSTVIAGGVVYAYKGHTGFDGSGDAFLFALDEYTGEEVWNVSIPEPEWGSWSSPAYHDGHVFTSTGKETWCIDATDGTVTWKFVNPSGHASCNGGPAIADGKVICGDWDAMHYYCLNEDTGKLAWTFKVTGYVQGTAAYDDGRFYLTSWASNDKLKGHVYCVNAEDGTEVWHNNNITQNCCGSPSLGKDMVYVSTYNFYGDGEVLALSKETGAIVWQQTVERTDSTPVIAYGNVYLTGGCSGYSDHRTFCFNATTGAPVWSTDAADDIGGWTCTVAVADGKVFVGGESHDNYFNYDRTFALDAQTGKVVWSYPQGGASPAVHDGRVFTVGNDGKLYVFGPAKPTVPVCDFSADSTSGIAPFTVQFTDLTTGDPETWAWDFNGDGKVDSTSQNPEYVFDVPGNYSVTLTVSNMMGSDSLTKTEYIVCKPKTVWYVDDDGSQCPDRDYATITEAVSAACEGGTVKVFAGTYHECLSFDKKLTLQGINRPVIDADSSAEEDAVNIAAPESTVRGFKITNTGDSRYAVHVGAGGAVIEDLVIDGCSQGIRIDPAGAGTSVLRNVITGCDAGKAISDFCGGNYIYLNDLGSVDASGVADTWHSPEEITYMYEGNISTSYLGNHWAGYAATDADSDGIGDLPYQEIDSYPLVASFKDYHEAVPENSWYQFQRDNTNSGVTSASGPVEEPGQIWRESASDTGINTPPVIVGDMAYVLTSDGKVTAFEKMTGNKVWESETGCAAGMQESTPAYGNGKLFVATFNGQLFAFDAETGKELWQAHVTDNNIQGPVCYADHRIYVGDGNFGSKKTRYYHCFDECGNELWKSATQDTTGFQWCGAASAGEYIVYPTHEGCLVSLNAATGALSDSLDLKTVRSNLTKITASAVYTNGAVYVPSKGGEENYLFKAGYDEETGKFSGVIWSTENHGSSSTPAVAGGRVYLGEGTDGTPGFLTCYDDATGTELWSYQVDNGVKGSPAVSVQGGKSYIYFTESVNDGYLYCLDDTGRKLWDYNPHSDTGYVSGGVAVSDGCLFLGTDAGYLHCISTGPSAEFTSDVRGGILPLNVKFTDMSTGNPSSWKWEFGDGTTSDEQNPLHTYNKEGEFTVRLTARNAVDSRIETKYEYISVHRTIVSLNPSNTTLSYGRTTDYTVVLSSAPDGLSRYNIQVVLENPDLAEIVNVSFPDWVSSSDTSGVPYDSVTLKGVDGNDAVHAGDENIILGTFTVRGDAGGLTGVTVGMNQYGGYLMDDRGMNFVPYFARSSLSVSSKIIPLPFPDMTEIPKDLDGDWVYEDLNANGRVDFADVSLYYTKREWIAQNQDMASFDYSGNGRIDLADVSLLYADIGKTA